MPEKQYIYHRGPGPTLLRQGVSRHMAFAETVVETELL